MIAFIKDVGILHAIWEESYLNFHSYELEGSIIEHFVNGDAGIVVDLSGDSVVEAFIKPLRRFWSRNPFFRGKRTLQGSLLGGTVDSGVVLPDIV